MLLGAYGRDAERRIGTGAAAAAGDPSGEVEVIHRGELALAWPRREAPTVAESADRLCVLNGEITAAPWLATARGGDRPCSPTELLEAWQRLGEEVLTGLRGSFLLVLWDGARRSGLLVRDPTGLGPLVRFDAPGCLLFASEIRQLLAVLPTTPPPDPVALSFWLSNDNCWDERTMFEGIRPLRPGHLLALKDGRARERRWWQLHYSPPAPISLEDAAESVADAIERSIKSRVRADENVGVLLSGGMDSTSVAALARRGLEGSANRLTGYSATFPNQSETDERELIDEACAYLRIPSVQMAVHGGSPISGALQFIREWRVPPLSTNGFFWPKLLGRIRNDASRLLLGGEGGDELFGLSPPLLADRLRSGRPVSALQLARRVPGGDRQHRRILARLCLRETAVSALPETILRRLRAPESEWMQGPEWLRSEYTTLHRSAAHPLRWRELDGPRWWAQHAHLLTVGREIIGVSDQLRRSYHGEGIRTHQPLLDQDLVELVLGLPPELAYSPRFDRPVLRAAASGLIPEQVRTRVTKSDFLPVLTAGVTASDLPLARELLLAPDARIREFIRPDLINAQLLHAPPDRYPAGAPRWTVDVWLLLSAECWLRAQEDPAQIPALLHSVDRTRTSFHLEASPI